MTALIEPISRLLPTEHRQAYALHVARFLGADPQESRRASWVEALDPLALLARFAVGMERRERLWLIPPRWSETEKMQLEQIVEADAPHGLPGDILIPTGGSSGNIKCARHTWQTLTAAASALHERLQTPISSWVNLPMAHVSGLMPVVRALVSGGQIRIGETLSPRPEPATGVFTVSLVGTQLKRLLDAGEAERYRVFDLIFVGGGPVDPALLDRAREAGLPLAPCYGATETAAMISMLPPDSFLQGRVNAGTLLPGVSVQTSHDGVLQVTAPSNCLGYAGEPRCEPNTPWDSGDEGRLDSAGFLEIHGRRDRMIFSGGEKINPLEVEAALRAIPDVSDARVVGQPDPEWGEIVVAIVQTPGDPTAIRATRLPLAAYKQPRRWVFPEHLPVQPDGKLDPAALAGLLAEK